MAKVSERALGSAVMQVLSTQDHGEATVRTLIRNVPSYIKLTAADTKESTTRPGEKLWEQRVRNQKSHDTVEGNVISQGFVERVGRGRYRLTKSGWSYLRNLKLA
jgi:hypothetical protein